MIITILIFLGLLSVLVIAHEWGHYYAAKKIGAKVEEFGLGFPPRIFAWKGKDGMEWSINWIPLGGFVKIKGESGEHRDDPDSFAKQSIPKRTVVLLAGVVMNLVLAAVLYSAGFLVGVPAVIEGDIPGSAIVADEAIRVTEIVAESPAVDAGFEIGDTVLTIDGQTYDSGEDARAALAGDGQDRVIEFLVMRNGEEVSLTAVPAYLDVLGHEGVGIAMVETGTVRYPFYLAPVKGIELTAFYTKEVVVAFVSIIGNLVVGQSAGVELAGPVGIAVITGEVASLGFVYLMQFAAILSINLAVINVLPFPALDGGRFAFVILEAIRRKPASPKLEAVVHNLGFALLMLLVIFVTYKDIVGLL